MSGANLPLGIIATAQDRASATLGRIERSTRNLDRAFGSLQGRMRSALEFHVVGRALNLVERGIYNLVHAIPDLIARGERWATVVDEIADVTGLSAQKASELAAVQSYLTDGTDSLGRALMVLGKNVVENEDRFKRFGIATRDARGNLRDVYDILEQTRGKLSATGSGLLSTAAAQKLFGRGAHDLLDLLQLTNRQWDIYVEQARRSGLVLTEAGLRAADQWTRTQRILNGAINGIGAQVLQGAAPALTGLVNAVSQAIQDNMGAIVRFVSGAITAVATMISSLLGFDLGALTIVEQVEQAGGAAGKAKIQLRDFADAQKQGAKAATEHATQLDGLREAQERLGKLQAAGLGFMGNMSNADRILAQQARDAEIKEAKQRVNEARRALSGMTSGAAAAGRQHAKAYWDQWRPGAQGGGSSPIVDGLKETVADARRFGLEMGGVIKDALFGEEKTPAGGIFGSGRTGGGLISALSGLGATMGTLGGHLVNLGKLLDGQSPLVLALGALALWKGPGLIPTPTRSGGGTSRIFSLLGPLAGLAGMAALIESIPKTGTGLSNTAAALPGMGRDNAFQRLIDQQNNPGVSYSENDILGPAGPVVREYVIPTGPNGFTTAIDQSNRQYLGDGSTLVRQVQDQTTGILGLSLQFLSMSGLLTQIRDKLGTSGTSGLAVRLTAVEKVNTAQDGTLIGHGNVLGLHADRLTGVENVNVAQGTALTTLGSAIRGLAKRVTGTENVNTAQGTVLTALGAAVGGLAKRVTGTENVNTTQGTALTALGTAVSGLATRVTGTENVNVAQGTALTALGTAVGGIATRLTAAETVNTTQDGTLVGHGVVLGAHADRMDRIVNVNQVQGTALTTLGKVVTNHKDRLDAHGKAITALVNVNARQTTRLDVLNTRLGLNVVRDDIQDARLKRIEQRLGIASAPAAGAAAGAQRMTIQLDRAATLAFWSGAPATSSIRPALGV